MTYLLRDKFCVPPGFVVMSVKVEVEAGHRMSASDAESMFRMRNGARPR